MRPHTKRRRVAGEFREGYASALMKLIRFGRIVILRFAFQTIKRNPNEWQRRLGPGPWPGARPRAPTRSPRPQTICGANLPFRLSVVKLPSRLCMGESWLATGFDMTSGMSHKNSISAFWGASDPCKFHFQGPGPGPRANGILWGMEFVRLSLKTKF